MQNINQTDYKNRLAHVKQLKTIPDNITTLCKDNNLLVLESLLTLLQKEEKFILNLCEPILQNISTKLKNKIYAFTKKQFNFNAESTYEILCTYFTNKNSKLVCNLLNLVCELAEQNVENVLLNNLVVLFEHADSEVKKLAIKLCVIVNKKCDVMGYVKEIKPILVKELIKEIEKNAKKEENNFVKKEHVNFIKEEEKFQKKEENFLNFENFLKILICK
ncbi:hypothetical protein TUBRATIS_24870 [Tubulinosema ratisbonensis]|uniref:XMAP215/Dis1/CLASP TOG domain-containing protein n=1 Tax=Tubulinosema ratisbonensis TaxID=291195 RepID=A0A437AJ22_9MICR|nr:hypothetical protein TUBRATIS_24870 [Tubulinosema ratisbonensis]